MIFAMFRRFEVDFGRFPGSESLGEAVGALADRYVPPDFVPAKGLSEFLSKRPVAVGFGSMPRLGSRP